MDKLYRCQQAVEAVEDQKKVVLVTKLLVLTLELKTFSKNVTEEEVQLTHCLVSLKFMKLCFSLHRVKTL